MKMMESASVKEEESGIHTISTATPFYPPNNNIKEKYGVVNKGFDSSDVIHNPDLYESEQKQTSKTKSCKTEKERENISNGESGGIPDGGWGWVVCLCSILSQGAVLGIINLFGVIYVHLMKEFGQGDPSGSFKASWIGSVCIGVTFLMCMLSSISCDIIGIRKTSMLGATIGSAGLLISAFVRKLEFLFLSFGFVLGIGNAFILCPSVVILGHYFKKRIGLANGLVSSGTAVLIILLSLALPQLLTHFHVKYTFLFLGGFYFLLIFSSLTFIPLPPKKEDNVLHKNHEKAKKWRTICNVNIWKNKMYVVWAISVAVVNFGFNVPAVHMIKYLTEAFPDEDVNFYVTLKAIIVSIGRLVFGKISDFKSVNRMYLQQSAFIVLGVTLIIIPWIKNYVGFIGLGVISGIFIGVSMSLNGPIAFDIFGQKASQAIGFLYGMMAIPAISGPPIAGMLFDHLQRYTEAFCGAGILMVIGSFIMCFAQRSKKLLSPTEIEISQPNKTDEATV